VFCIADGGGSDTKCCPGAPACVPVTGMCVAVLHSVIIGADKTSFGKQSSIAPIMQHYVTQLGEVLRSGAIISLWKTNAVAATGSWRKSAAEFRSSRTAFCCSDKIAYWSIAY